MGSNLKGHYLLLLLLLFISGEKVAAQAAIVITEANQQDKIQLTQGLVELTNLYPGYQLLNQQMTIENQLDRPVSLNVVVDKESDKALEEFKVTLSDQKNAQSSAKKNHRFVLNSTERKQMWVSVTVDGEASLNSSQEKSSSVKLIVVASDINKDRPLKSRPLPQMNERVNSYLFLGGGISLGVGWLSWRKIKGRYHT